MDYIVCKTPKAPWKIILPKDISAFSHKTIDHPIVYNRYRKKAFCFACGQYFHYAAPGKNLPVARTVYAMNHFCANSLITCPICGHQGYAVPHTRKQWIGAMIFTARAEKGTIYFTLAEAWYRYCPDEFENLSAKKGEIFVVEIGKIGRDEQKTYLNWGDHLTSTGKNVYVHHSISNMMPYIHPSVPTAIKKSCLKYSGITVGKGRCYSINEKVKRMSLHAKYPQLEYLRKAGLEEIEDSMVWDRPTYLRPNWKKKDLTGLLGISSQDIDKLKQWKMFDIDHIAAYKEIRKTHKRITKHDMENFFSFFSDIGPFTTRYAYREDFRGLDPVKTAKYLEVLFEENRPKCGHGAYGYTRSTVASEYADYLKQLRDLGYPETEYYLYPKDFFEAHDRVSKELREKLDREEQKKKRGKQKMYEEEFLPKLKELAWSDGTYIIRPLENYADFSAEGRNNTNCVASYYDRATAGKTGIFVIRLKSAPDTSLVTVEMQDGKLVQCRAKGNQQPDDDVQAFADRWMKEIVKKKGKRKAA